MQPPKQGCSGPRGAGSLSVPQAKPVKAVKSPWWGNRGSRGRTVCDLFEHPSADSHVRRSVPGCNQSEPITHVKVWSLYLQAARGRASTVLGRR